MNDTRNQYYVKAREELSKANTDIETQQQVVMGRSDSLQRAIFKAPVRGVIKEIDVTTLGGVIPQNGKLMTIVPLEDKKSHTQPEERSARYNMIPPDGFLRGIKESAIDKYQIDEKNGWLMIS